VTVVVALLISMAAFALVGYPLLRPRRADGESLSTNHRTTDDLLAERDAAYAAIKELEFEYHLGNLSRQDYEDLRARYRQRAADILRRLDVAEREASGRARTQRRVAGPRLGAAGEPATAGEKARALEPSRDGGAAEEIERAVALLRRQSEGKAPASKLGDQTRPACPSCRCRVQPDDRFCGRCGARLSNKHSRAEDEG
jgi:hypothetical protein